MIRKVGLMLKFKIKIPKPDPKPKRAVTTRPKQHADDIYVYDDKDFNTASHKYLANDKLNEIFSDLPVIHKPYIYPFTTKKFVDKIIPSKSPLKEVTVSSLRKFQRPYFSPRFDSWEMDFFIESIVYEGDEEEVIVKGKAKKIKNNMKIQKYYLIFVNINTKFAQLYPLYLLQNRTTKFVTDCIEDLRSKGLKIDNLRSDKDAVFRKDLEAFLKTKNIHYYATVLRYVNENRVVDRVIKTIRDAIGVDKNILIYFPEVGMQVVEYYNDTPHSAYKNKFTPRQVQYDNELEAWYIRTQQLKLIDTLRLQHKFFPRYNNGDLLIVYRPLDKTDEKFKKRRKNFQELAVFVKYDGHGNVTATLLTPEGKPGAVGGITLPLYNTKFLCDAESFKRYGIPEAYKQFLLLSIL
jgi:hypothetical protein